MRILSVSPLVVNPPNRGAAVRTYNLLTRLSRNHEIRQFSLVPTGRRHAEGFAERVQATPSYEEYRYYHPLLSGMADWFRRTWVLLPVFIGPCVRLIRPALLREWLEWADVTIVEFPWLFDFCRRQRRRGPIVLATHNIETPTLARFAREADARITGKLVTKYMGVVEGNAAGAADLVLTVSPDDRSGFVDLGAAPDRVTVIPNGADTAALFPVSEEVRRRRRKELSLPERPTALFVGGNLKVPHKMAIDWIRRIAAKMPDVTFLVVGGVMPEPMREGNLIAAGIVDDAALYHQASDFGFCPIEFGGGTKLKTLEALAAGLPSVVFEECVRGTEIRDKEHVLVVEKSEDAVIEGFRSLMADSEMAHRLGRAGRELVEAKYSWDRIAADLEQKLIALLR
jgi:glycosyltransferase involved in cell wall biosynthesis